jgi:DNA-binding NarL/FixJ family response regulator
VTTYSISRIDPLRRKVDSKGKSKSPSSTPSVDPYDAARPAACQGFRQAVLSYSVLIVDDSSVVRRLLRSYIEPHAPWRVCGEAENGMVAVQKVKELHPDVVILDFQMPVMNGIEAARQIALLAPNTAMVMLTMHNVEELSKQARAAGIKDVLSKSDVVDHLLASLNVALADGT